MLAEVECFDKWLRRKNPHASTHVHYTNDLHLFFTWLDKPPAQVTVRDVDRFIDHCQEAGHASATINRRLAALRTFYTFWQLERAEAPRNPVLPKRHSIRQGTRLPRDLDDATVQKLFALITPPRDRAVFVLMLRCGLRVGEVHNLSLPDLYLAPTPGQLPRLWVRGKGGAQRLAYLSAEAQAALEAWLQVRPCSPADAVFLNRFGQRLTVTGIQARLGHYCREAGLWVTCHQFRHTFGRHLVEAHVPITTIQRLLGHGRLRTTEVYLHLSDGQLQADYEAAMRQVSSRLALDAASNAPEYG